MAGTRVYKVSAMRSLTCICLLVFAGLLHTPPASADGGTLSASEAFRQSKEGDLVIIDVRSPREWQQTGVPSGARTITMHDPKGMTAFLNNVLATVGGNKNTRIAMICARGNRSRYTQQFLVQHGFTHVLDVSEGMLGREPSPGWLARNLPTKKCESC